MLLSNAQWDRVRGSFPEDRPARIRRGRRPVPTRTVLDAVLWTLVTEGSWRSLPQCYPSYQTVHRRYLGWKRVKARRQLLAALVDELRGRNPALLAGSRDADRSSDGQPAPERESVLGGLESIAAKIGPPMDYFRGASPAPVAEPANVLVFTRLSRSSMQPRDAFRHRRHVLNVCVATTGCVALDGRWFRLEPGQGLLVFPHQTHVYANFDADRLCWVFVSVELGGVAAIESLRDRVVSLTPAALGRLRELCGTWLDRSGRRTDLIPLTTLLISDLLVPPPRKETVENDAAPGRAAYQKSGGPGGDRAGQLLPRIHGILDSAHPECPIKTLSSRLGISESRLRAAFRTQTGVSLGRYLREFRINRAAAMLTATSFRISEIAERCGFDSLYSFSRAFRRVKGMPARNYRRQTVPRSVR